MSIKAVYDKVVVQLEDRTAESKGGIFIPERVREAELEGKVLSIGPMVDLPIEVGSTVGVARTSGTVAIIGGKEILFVQAEKLLYVR